MKLAFLGKSRSLVCFTIPPVRSMLMFGKKKTLANFSFFSHLPIASEFNEKRLCFYCKQNMATQYEIILNRSTFYYVSKKVYLFVLCWGSVKCELNSTAMATNETAMWKKIIIILINRMQ